MKVELKKKANNLVVALEGELDHHTAVTFRSRVQKTLEQGKVKNLILDLSGLSFMDSSGVGALLGRYNYLALRGGKLAVYHLTPQVNKVFENSGLFQIIQEYPSEKEALQDLVD